MSKGLTGTKLAGSNPIRGRAEFDYYATNPEAVHMLFGSYKCNATHILEPCVGGGNIAYAMSRHFPDAEITAIDIVDRGYPGTIIDDFLSWKTDKKFDCIITNPPFSHAQEFIEKGLHLLSEKGQMMMFLKIQFLEGAKRRELFNIYPPKYIYVFSKRMGTWQNGEEIDSLTGKRLSTTMCHAWFIWEEGFHGEPVVRWL